MNNRYFYKLLSIILISFFLINPTFSQRTKSSQQSGEQRNAEKGLKDNRFFFFFLNSSISNFGSKTDKLLFKEAIQRDIIAQLLYMKFLFHDSFIELRKSQKILIKLYISILEKDINLSKKLLNEFSPEIIWKNIKSSKEYLRLGYRDNSLAKIYLVMGNNYKKTLYSMRLHKYIHAIKLAKHSKKYAFLSIIKSRQNIFDLKKKLPSKFDDLTTSINNISMDKEKQQYYFLIHLDNYYRTEKSSYYENVWMNPNLNEINDYKMYLKKN